MKIRLHKLQIARRAVQWSVIAMLLLIPAIARYSNYLAARELGKNLEKWNGTLQGETLAAIDTAFRMLPGAETERAGKIVRDRSKVLEYAQGFRGGPWSAEIAGISMTDPLAAAESVAARKSFSKVLLIGLIIPVALTLLFGRIFCSWICPMGLLLELTDPLRRLLTFFELPPRNAVFSRSIKYTLLGVGLILSSFFAVPVLAYIYPPAILNREGHDLVFGIFDRVEAGHAGFWAGGLTWMSLLIAGIALFEVTVSRRWWCRYLCPGGGLYSLLGAFRPVRVRLLESKCTRCTDCVTACPVGLNPMNNKMGIECDNCGVCISHCGAGALAYGLWRPATATAGAGNVDVHQGEGTRLAT